MRTTNSSPFVRRVSLLLAALGLAAGVPSQARQLRDIHPTGHSFPQNFTTVGKTIFFTASEPLHGIELWKTDGTPGGTMLVKDIRPGTLGSNPAHLTAHANKLFFSAHDGQTGKELWVSDGTAAGTRRVMDIRRGVLDSSPREMISYNGALFFQADDGQRGLELWRSDGTLFGTRIVRDLHLGRTGSSPREPTIVGGMLYFTASGTDSDGNALGRELHRSDGTASGTGIVLDLVRGPGSNDPAFLTGIGNELYFRVKKDGSKTDRELWRTDGTSLGTRLVTNHVVRSNPMRMGNRLWFTARTPVHGSELFSSDGTPAGTSLFMDIDRGLGSSNAEPVAAIGGKLLFVARDPGHGRELWITDGTTGGTKVVKDIAPGRLNGLSARPVVPVGDRHVVFVADDQLTGRELWVSNGSEHGTWRLQDFNPGSAHGSPDAYRVCAGSLLVRADNGKDGLEPWAMPLTEVTEASFTSYGTGCLGTGRRPFAAYTNNLNGGTLSSSRDPGLRIFALEAGPTIATTVVHGYELLTHSLTGRRRRVGTAIYLARTSGAPESQPIATGSMELLPATGFYRTVFAQPVTIPARRRFFVTVDSEFSRLPSVSAGTARTTYSRSKSSTRWLHAQTDVRWSYRVLLRGIVRAAPEMGNHGTPALGSMYRVTVDAGRAESIAVLLTGFSQDVWSDLRLPLDLTPVGASGCRLLVSADLFDPVGLNSLGGGGHYVFIPSLTELMGFRLFHQWAVLDSGANALGVALSEAGRAAIGR